MSQESEADEAEIRRLIAGQIEAYNRGEGVRVLEIIAQDRIILNPHQPVVRGRGDLGELQTFLNNVQHSIDLDVDELLVFGEWAFERGVVSGRLARRPSAQPSSYTYKYARIWRRKDDGWKIYLSIWNSDSVS